MLGNPASKKSSNRSGWRGKVAIFIAVFLVLVSLKGFIKPNLSANLVEKSKWDNTSSFVVNILDSSSSLFIFQKDPKRAVMLTLGQNKETTQNIKEVLNNTSLLFGMPVDNYIKFKNKTSENLVDYSKEYSSFVSWTTPIKILTTGWNGNSLDTNISRIDALSLWWQLKSIGVNSLKTADLPLNSESTNTKESKNVLSANTQEFNRSISKYLENTKIVNEDYQINIINASGEFAASRLANSFITSIGGRVVSITGDSNLVIRCTLKVNRSSYTASYLAKIFDCDIKDASQDADSGQITLVLGKEFAKRYFE